MSIKLIKFDTEYFKSLPDRSKILFDNNQPFYTIINQKKQKVGVCGVLRNMFFQILIHPDFRGQNIVKQASDEVIKKLKLKQLFATIDITNIASLKAHLKAGFKELPATEVKKLRKTGKLKSTQTRLIKKG
jgi:RimJ/RimL family protein N-acetyltransferase